MQPADAVPPDADDLDDSVDRAADTLFSGENAPLRPLFDAIFELTHALGDDVSAVPEDGYMALVRRTPFLALAPGPDVTLRVGLVYAGRLPTHERLEPADGFAGATHWLHLDADALDTDIIALEPLVEAAYEQHG
jgi:uncharacterized protein DUF5655